MAQLNVKLAEERLEALRRYGARRRTPVAWLTKNDIDYVLGGGQPLALVATESPDALELTVIDEKGGAFDWLADEPELYSDQDADPPA